MGESRLIYYVEQDIDSNFTMVLKIHEVKDDRYQFGIKYSFYFGEYKSEKKVLMDNHFPKGDHYHLDECEFFYQFVDEYRLIEDFKKLVYQHFGVKL